MPPPEPSSERRGAVFFDRDGVLNRDDGYVHRIQDLHWTPGAADAVREVNAAGLYAFVVTNQSGVARGLFGAADVEVLHARMREALLAQGARVDDVRYCPHLPGAAVAAYDRDCGWRKPAPGMILDLARAWNVDLAASLLVGDRDRDLQAGRAAAVGSLALFQGGDLAAFLRPRLAALG